MPILMRLGLGAFALMTTVAWATPDACEGALTAGRLVCTLKSGRRTARVSIDLNDATTHGETLESFDAPGAKHYDVSYSVEASCEKEQCLADVTFFSSKLEDEAGSLSVRWTRGQRGEIHREALTGAPDKRAYVFICAVE